MNLEIDWRDPSKYPDPDSQDWDMWAWEFLRRNSDYQSGYQDLVDRNKDLPPLDYDINGMLAFAEPWGLVSWPKDPREAFDEDEPARFVEYPRILSKWFSNRWERRPQMFDRDLSAATIPIDEEFAEIQAIFEDATMEEIFGEHPGFKIEPTEIGIVISLDQPLEPQINRAHEMLKNSYPFPDHRGRPDKMALTLRVLDAKTQGALEKDIAKLFDNHYRDPIKAVGNRWKKAKRLRDGGYRALLGLK